MSILVDQEQYFGNVANNYKVVTVNVGCKVSHPMTNPQPTQNQVSSKPDKSTDNSFAEARKALQPIFKAIEKCSEETTQEVTEKILNEIEEVEN